MKIDETFRSLIPPLSEEEFKQLKENILKDGCREPLVVWNDTLIDGHNRYKICTENNIEFKTVQKEFKDKQEATEWIILNQFGRRNLSNFQRSELALKLKPMIQARAKERQKEYHGNQYESGKVQKSAQVQSKTKSRDELAKIAGVSHDTIEKVSLIKEKGSEEQVERARRGGKGNSINAIVKEIKNEPSKETKVCKCCGEEKSIYSFYKTKGICISCFNNQTEKKRAESNVIKDFKGDIKLVKLEVAKLVNEKADEIVKDLYNTNKVIDYGCDDLIDEIKTYFEYFTDGVKRVFDEKSNIVNENKEKIKATLEEERAAINTLKEMYLYE